MQVISATFRPLIAADAQIPKALITTLLTRFSTQEGYELFPDVLPFFRHLRQSAQRSACRNNIPDLVVGVLTNSDDRVPSILSSLSLSLGSKRYGHEIEGLSIPHDNSHDIDFVAMSYDVGFAKPDPRIFEATKTMVQHWTGEELHCIHVGDEPTKDYHAALNAGWQGLLLDRKGECTDCKVKSISSLTDLTHHLDM